jgi:hypothetical protein
MYGKLQILHTKLLFAHIVRATGARNGKCQAFGNREEQQQKS